jgi:hypothetical protein
MEARPPFTIFHEILKKPVIPNEVRNLFQKAGY